jgi:hypothetical protein
MKKFTLFLMACLMLMGSQLFAQAQTACDNVTAPEVQSGMNSYDIGGTIWTPAPPVQTAAVNLPTTEYLIVKIGTCALDSARTACDTTNGGGDVIIGGDDDGIFNPGDVTRYGIDIQAGDTFAVVAVGYDLSQVRSLLNQILTGTTSIGAPCCSIFDLQQETAGFCDTLNNLGIASQNDINGIEDVLTVFDAFANAQLSVNGLIYYMQQVNSYGALLDNSGCGTTTTSGDIVCFGINPNQEYMYRASNTVAITDLEAVSNFGMFPNPTNGDVTLSVDLSTPTDLTLNIYNAFGQKVSTQHLGTLEGAQNFTAQTSTFPAGMYMVELTDGQNSTTAKLIVR